MSTIVVRAKVQIIMDEGEFEASQQRDLGDVQFTSQKWVYRRVGLPAEDIRRVIAYTKDKTMLEDSDGKFTLVFEPFQQVYEKWKEAYEEPEESENEENETEINESGENNLEDDED